MRHTFQLMTLLWIFGLALTLELLSGPLARSVWLGWDAAASSAASTRNTRRKTSFCWKSRKRDRGSFRAAAWRTAARCDSTEMSVRTAGDIGLRREAQSSASMMATEGTVAIRLHSISDSFAFCCLFADRLGRVDALPFFLAAMRVVLQRVLSASVTVDGKMVSKIGKGIMCLVGIRDNDDQACSEVLAKKILVLEYSISEL